MRFKQFTKPQVLASIGREHLWRLFEEFGFELRSRGLALPDLALPLDRYLGSLAHLLLASERLPDELVETLFIIEEMATAEGQERLETGFAGAGIRLELGDTASQAEIAVQAWLKNPELVITLHNRLRMGRLSAFDYFASSRPRDLRRKISLPSREVLENICRDLDRWFREHNRGRGTTHVDAHELDGEFIFLIRHGDTYTRTVRMNGKLLEPIHYRPAKDDILVYTPRRDEIRIHAGTKGERELYRQTFGQHLRGNSNQFCQLMTYTLEPLRTDGIDALRPTRESGIEGVGLREVEMFFNDGSHDTVVRRSRDLVLSSIRRNKKVVPDTGTIVRAMFDVRFEGSTKSRWIELRPPNSLRLGRYCDARSVDNWLSDRGFRISGLIISEPNEDE